MGVTELMGLPGLTGLDEGDGGDVEGRRRRKSVDGEDK